MNEYTTLSDLAILWILDIPSAVAGLRPAGQKTGIGGAGGWIQGRIYPFV